MMLRRERGRDEDPQKKKGKGREGGLRKGERGGAANYHWGETGALLETGVGASMGGWREMDGAAPCRECVSEPRL